MINFHKQHTTNATRPATSTVYLSMLIKTETLKINATSNGQPISIELYEGVFQPSENTTNWWLGQNLIARSPNGLYSGEVNLLWFKVVNPYGSYMLVIALRNEYNKAKVDTQICC